MPQSLSKVYVHITFSTKNRYPFIDNAIENRLWAYVAGVCKALDCHAVKVGGHRDHIHICCLLSKKVTQVALLEQIKKESSKWIKLQGREYEKFYWQDGYCIFSVNPTEIGKVVEYIDKQGEHHAKLTFRQELVAFLNKYEVKYDEQWLWD